ncbi:hypothetical protein THASP1DRAFT_29601 [Thamnocephalis sphaerospora]|uniref:LSM complex subunit LSM4 n=1 Tax=Thamnocephalis sphaerospora TaxID=78915 RepID=A0A4P9XR90_9FUNG|nr:hypothetical protein THASP1DRAFT_29601 [Thamnocephalis sphaerospora]|eukprot:RKP08597.1 hypothetical protein THASP1DRAFT_29601 [Thamnocephalis sphaerospora]
MLQQLPLSLLTTSKGHPMLVELKNGETYNGHLVNCDNFMNLTLQGVIQTSPDGDRFWRLKECYIRGSTIKYLRIPDSMIDIAKEEASKNRGSGGRGGQRGGAGRGHGRGGGRGGGRGNSRGRGR